VIECDVRDGENMPRGEWPDEALAELAERRDALRQAAGLPGADPRALVDAALTELDGAIDALAAAATPTGPAGGDDPSADAVPESVKAERRLLHAAFQRTPVALFLLEQDGTIRRANGKAGDLLGAPSGYSTGKPFASFVDLPFRAALRTQLAAVARTGVDRAIDCRVLGADGPLDVSLLMAAVELAGDPALIMVTATPRAGVPKGPADGGDADASADTGERGGGKRPAAKPRAKATADSAIGAMTKRLDMVTAVTRLLLDNSTFSEAVTLQRCARLLAGELADWVIIDIERGGRLRRQFAAGPRGGTADRLARDVRSVDPGQDSAPAQVHSAGKSVLLAHADDAVLLGKGPDGTPLLMLLGATSLICVPISDGTTGYGTLTLVRQAAMGRFGVADLGLAEELGQHLAIAIRVDRMVRHRSEVAEALQASLLPANLPPSVPGFQFAAAYVGATQWQEISGDFYDVFRAGDGWAIAIGDVCGKGQDAAAMTAAARHSIRAFTHVHDAPAQVLSAANEVLLAGDYGERFVTAVLAFLRQRGRRTQVRLGGCGHPGPAVVRADGRVEILEPDGMPLGLFEGAQFNELEFELREGDLLLFYTDGVTEARSADLEFFEDRLADELAAMAGREAADTVRAVQELVTSFSQGDLRDDVTILAVKLVP
jgi:serine phosphatase RsbU (regulator of sigma subunit)/PAS domain-containing protein